jgi:hypothetical protein
MNNHRRLRALLALLLVATAVLFTIGTSIERSQRSSHKEKATSVESAGQSTGSAGEAGSGESGGETQNSTETAPKTEATAAKTEVKSETGQKLFGIDTESVGAMIAAIAVSLGLAAAVWFRRERWWLWLTVAFGIAFAIGDVRELIHQINESRTGVAVIAAILIAAHLRIAGLAGHLASRTDPARHPVEAPTVT